jgi:hypothetical protein
MFWWLEQGRKAGWESVPDLDACYVPVMSRATLSRMHRFELHHLQGTWYALLETHMTGIPRPSEVSPLPVLTCIRG